MSQPHSCTYINPNLAKHVPAVPPTFEFRQPNIFSRLLPGLNSLPPDLADILAVRLYIQLQSHSAPGCPQVSPEVRPMTMPTSQGGVRPLQRGEGNFIAKGRELDHKGKGGHHKGK